MLLRLAPLFPAALPLRRRHHGGAFVSPPHLYHQRNTTVHNPSFPLFCTYSPATKDTWTFDSELHRLLSILPDSMNSKLTTHPDLHTLIEVVMDLGRTPLARFPDGDLVLSHRLITSEDLQTAASQVGDFAGDNRAGISRTLHRISAIRNRKGEIVGLTCRVGRAVSGAADSIRDLIGDGQSLLLIGPPGVGKTTIIREIARILADEYKKRVMIVDTSNEIGGDGDIPHPGIGNARRMQVPDASMQHKVLIEAVENHMPQAIIIDEIGTKLEAMAASTIAQRGIQLVATAHGITIENLIMNPSLEMLVGGIQSVTLGDEEASRRGVQKTVLERKGPSTFACAVEIISKTELRLHRSLEATVDAILAGRNPKVESRQIYSNNLTNKMPHVLNEATSNIILHATEESADEEIVESYNGSISSNGSAPGKVQEAMPDFCVEQVLRLYVYGILEASVVQAINQMRLEDVIVITQDISEANAFLALQSKLKKNPRIEAVAKAHDLPIYVTKTTSLEHLAKAIRSLSTKLANDVKDFSSEDEPHSSEKTEALEEARLVIEQTVIPKGEIVELLPRPSYIISAQMDLVREYNLKGIKVGKEPDAFLRILPVCSTLDDGGSTKSDGTTESLESGYCDNMDGSSGGPMRLPLLPD